MPSLLSLPHEIRDMIFYYTVPTDQVDSSSSNKTTKTVRPPVLAHTCRQLRSEVLPVWRGNNLFIAVSTTQLWIQKLLGYEDMDISSWLQQIKASGSNYIQRLRIVQEVWLSRGPNPASGIGSCFVAFIEVDGRDCYINCECEPQHRALTAPIKAPGKSSTQVPVGQELWPREVLVLESALDAWVAMLETCLRRSLVKKYADAKRWNGWLTMRWILASLGSNFENVGPKDNVREWRLARRARNYPYAFCLIFYHALMD